MYFFSVSVTISARTITVAPSVITGACAGISINVGCIVIFLDVLYT